MAEEEWVAAGRTPGGRFEYEYVPKYQNDKEVIITTLEVEAPAQVELEIFGCPTWEGKVPRGVTTIPTPKVWKPGATFPVVRSDVPCKVTTMSIILAREVKLMTALKGRPFLQTDERTFDASGATIYRSGKLCLVSMTLRAETLSGARIYVSPRAFLPIDREILIGSQQALGSVTFDFHAPFTSGEVDYYRIEADHVEGKEPQKLEAKLVILNGMRANCTPAYAT